MNRVVITGMGIISPNAHGLKDFEQALKEGRSGIRFYQELADLNFNCQVAGVPQNIDSLKQEYFTPDALRAMNSSMIYAGIAALDCWKDAGFTRPEPSGTTVDWECGAIIGTGIGGMDTIAETVVPTVNAGKVKRLGSTMVEQVMASAPSANIGGLLGLGGQVTTNSSACSTGTEALADAFFAIREGRIKRMLAGGTEGSSLYIWAGFDAMRVLARGFNDHPEKASRPTSATASGFVPGSGAGILMLENLESAKARGARIYAEILGAHVNCGGQRNGGSISAPNSESVQRCIREAIKLANIQPKEIDLINGHLTATMADTKEIANWQEALACSPEKLPLINATKSMIGHGLGAAGGMECVASVLQLAHGFVHGSINAEDLHPKLEPFADRIVRKTISTDAKILAKASFGFGDVNACLIFKKC